MIQSKQDLKHYLLEDRKAQHKILHPSLNGYFPIITMNLLNVLDTWNILLIVIIFYWGG